MAKVVSQRKKYSNSQAWYIIDGFRARLLLIFTCVICYGNTVFNDYALDDDFAFTKNTYVQKGLAGIPGLLTHSYISSGTKSFDYRPVSGITLIIEKQFFGNAPHISHLVNILFYIILILIVYQVLIEVFHLNSVHTLLPLIITAFYAVHPAHTEVVASIKNREEILSTLFAFAALLYFYRFCNQPQFRISTAVAVFLLMILSLLSKLTSLPMLAVMILTGIYYGFYKKNKRFVFLMAIVTVCAAVYFLILYSKLQRTFYFYENPLALNHDLSVKLGTSFQTVWFYFRFMFYPYPFCFYYGYNTIPLADLTGGYTLVSMLVHAGMLFGGLWLFARRRITGLFLLCYLAYLSIYSNLLMIYTGIVSERALFVPGLWLISAIAVPITVQAGLIDGNNNSVFKRTLIAAGSVIFVVFMWLTIQRNFEWQNALTLMSADIKHLQNSTLANFFYGSVLQEKGEETTDSSRQAYLSAAKKYYLHSLAVSPGYAQPYYKLGMIYEYDENKNDSAFMFFKTAHQVDTALTPACFQLAKLYFIRGNYGDANPLFELVYKKIPDDTFNLFFYSQSLYFSGDSLRAYTINDSLLAFAPDDFHPYLNRGMFNVRKGNLLAAESDLERVIQSGYRNERVLSTLNQCYVQLGQTDKAAALQKALTKPGNNP